MVTLAQKRSLQSPASVDAPIVFLSIRHPALDAPVRYVKNTVGIIWRGDLYHPAMFDKRLVTDSDQAPYTEILIPNVDSRIGMAVRRMTDRGEVSIDVCMSSDFDQTTDPHTEIGTATPIYSMSDFELKSVRVNYVDVVGSVGLPDYSVEPWPSVRATQERFPGLFE